MESPYLKSVLIRLYETALSAVKPQDAVQNAISLHQKQITIDNISYSLGEYRKVFLIGAGKAAVPMASAMEQLLGDRLSRGLLVVKYGHGGFLKNSQVLEAGHPEPDENGVAAALKILNFLDQNLTSQDLLFVLLSGGGSALTPLPVKEITFEEKKKTTSILLNSGATIHEINTIRKHLSCLKGGRLLEHTHGAQVISLLLSDVVGDDVSSIASGPTAPDPTTFGDCMEILTKYRIQAKLPDPVLSYLKSGNTKKNPSIVETPNESAPIFLNVHNSVIGSNLLALRAAATEADRLGFAPLILSSSIDGNTEDVAKVHVAIAREILQNSLPLSKPCCIISGGETTVRVTGSGKGGRNQEFALCCAREMASWKNDRVLIASLGSDGTDGPTNAAGAWATPDTFKKAASLGLRPEVFLEQNDSYHFFQKLGGLIFTGPTQTNVMDLRFILVGE